MELKFMDTLYDEPDGVVDEPQKIKRRRPKKRKAKIGKDSGVPSTDDKGPSSEIAKEDDSPHKDDDPPFPNDEDCIHTEEITVSYQDVSAFPVESYEKKVINAAIIFLVVFIIIAISLLFVISFVLALYIFFHLKNMILEVRSFTNHANKDNIKNLRNWLHQALFLKIHCLYCRKLNPPGTKCRINEECRNREEAKDKEEDQDIELLYMIKGEEVIEMGAGDQLYAISFRMLSPKVMVFKHVPPVMVSSEVPGDDVH